MVRPRPCSSETFGSQPSSVRARVMSGWRTLGSSVGQRLVDDLALRAGHVDDEPRDLLDRHLLRVPDVDRVVLLREHQTDEAVHEVADVAEAARLRAVAEHRHVLVAQRLRHEGRHRAPVLHPHARAVGVEDADDLRVDAVEPVVGHRHRLGEPLRLVVDAARADGVDVAPVGLLLRVLERIAVDLGGGRDHEGRALGLRQAERLVRAERADLQRLDRQLEVVHRAGGAGPVQHVVHRAVHLDVVRDVVADELEVAIAQVRDVGQVSGQQVVDAHHRVAAVEQGLGQMGADEAGRSGDDDARHATPRPGAARGRAAA